MNAANTDRRAIATRCSTALLLSTVVFCGSGCGLKFSGFMQPLYRIPSGYSETYLEHLERHERYARQKSVLPTVIPNGSAQPLIPPRPTPIDNGTAGRAAGPRPHNPPPAGSGERGGSTAR